MANATCTVTKALNRYDYIRKVEPMQRAVKELKATAWLVGLRKDQTEHRQSLERVTLQEGIYKIYPILSWNSASIHRYLTDRNLPYHPYFDLGYVTWRRLHLQLSLNRRR